MSYLELIHIFLYTLNKLTLADQDIDCMVYLQRTPSGVAPAAGSWTNESYSKDCKMIGKHSVYISSVPNVIWGALTRLLMRGRLRFRVEEDEDLYLVFKNFTDTTPSGYTAQYRLWYYIPPKG